MSSNNQEERKPLLDLDDLEISPEDVKDWSEHPVTRLWFKRLALIGAELEKTAVYCLKEDSADLTLSGLAKIKGAQGMISQIMGSVDHGDFLFSEEDFQKTQKAIEDA